MNDDEPRSVDMFRMQREELRWRLLRALEAGRPGAVSEKLLLRVAAAVNLPTTPREIRVQLEYLEGLKLVSIEKGAPDQVKEWMAKLTPEGVNVTDYTSECPAGIVRPPRRY